MERQLRLHRADLLAVAERRDCYGGIYIAKFCRFEQRKRRNALASGKLESICDQRVILNSVRNPGSSGGFRGFAFEKTGMFKRTISSCGR